jgi:hypothetical protein
MKRTKELMKQIILIALAIAMVVTLIPVLNIGTCDVSEASASLYADDGYKALIDKTTVGENTVVKVGKYYFKYKYDNNSFEYTTYMSTNSKSGFKKTPINNPSYACTNGKQAYYVRKISNSNFILCKYVFSSRKETKIKKMPAKNYYGNSQVGQYKVAYVYGNNIAINTMLDDFNGTDVGSYIFNLKTKKITAKNVFLFGEAIGKYIITEEFWYNPDIIGTSIGSNVKLSIYQFTSSGIEEVKGLSNYGNSYEIIGNKLIYICRNSKYSKTYIYQCNMDGTSKKNLTVFNGNYVKYETTSEYCILYDYSYGKTFCIYNFKTKKKATITVKNGEISCVTPLGNEIYYCTSVDDSERILFKCKSDGTGRKKIGVLKNKSGGSVWILYITSKYCVFACYEEDDDYYANPTYYKYTYSTKKIQKTKL